MKEYFIRYILSQVFKNSPHAVLSAIHQSGKGWVTVLTDRENGQAYLVSLVPIESTKIVAPETFNQLMNLN